MSDLFEDKDISPMLLYETVAFDDPEYIYELKLDGIRCLAYLDKNKVILRNKRNKDVTEIYPELAEICKCTKEKCILDGELVVFTDGKPNFFALQKRSLMTDKFKIKLLSNKYRVEYVAYDMLYLKNKQVTDLPLMKRKELMTNIIKEGYGLSVSRFIEERGIDFFNLAKQQGLEGIVAKKKDGKYYIGKRAREWIKIKVMQEEDLLICGYQPNDDGNPKDLILGHYDENNKLIYKGKIYLGISKEERKVVKEFAKSNKIATAHFNDIDNSIWLKPELVGTVTYMHLTDKGAMRQPVWKGLKET